MDFEVEGVIPRGRQRKLGAMSLKKIATSDRYARKMLWTI